MKALLAAGLLILTCDSIQLARPKDVITAQARGVEWLYISKESETEVPDSPEQVLITVKTRDGHKWVATWEQQR